MRWALFLLLAGVVAGQTPQASQPPQTPGGTQPGAMPADAAERAKQKARIEGRVISATTSEPVRRANLSLRGSAGPAGGPTVMIGGGGGGMMPALPGSVSGTTDNEGKFLLENLDPGRYYLSADKAGFVRQNYGARGPTGIGTVLSLEAGTHLKEMVIKMTPQGVISGRVLDDEGEPVQGTMVMAMRWGYQRGKKTLVPAGGAGTNDQGEYRLANMSPGRYYLQSRPGRIVMGMGPERSGNPKAPQEGFINSYYPNASAIDQAAPIDLTPGADLRGIDFRLTKVRVYSVKGKVIGPDGGPLKGAMVMAQPREQGGGPMMVTRVMIADGPGQQNPEGIFEVNNLAPGSYTLNVTSQPTGMISTRHQHPVEITNENIDNLVIHVPPPIDLSGTLAIESDDPTKKMANPRVMLMAEGMMMGNTSATANEEGKFTIKNLAASKYEVNVMAGGYVKSIKFGPQTIEDTSVDLSAGGGGPLEIVVSMNGGEISGRVENEDGQAMPGITVTIAATKNKRDQYKQAQTDQNGAFKISGVAPGEYKVYGWEEIDPGAFQDPDFVKPFGRFASTVEVKEKSSPSVTLKMISRETIEAEKQKMR